MKLGAENQNKVIGAIALVVLAVVVIAWELWPAPTTSAATPVPSAHITQTPGKKGNTATTLDPSLQTDLLKESEDTKYEGNGKNIFVAQVEIPQPIDTGKLHSQVPVPQPDPGPPPPPPPAPIPLKFYGFASQTGGQKQIFLAENDDIFIAKEGDIVDRRYKVVHIYPMAVEIEDMLSNNRQQIPLTTS